MSGSIPPGGGDPSMDDILASIRKILNEDDQPPPAPAPRVPPGEAMQLTPDMMITPPESLAIPLAEAPTLVPTSIIQPPPVAAPAVAPPPPAAPPAVAEPPPPPRPPEPVLMSLEPTPPAAGLLDPMAAAAAVAALGELTRAVSQDRSASVTRGGPSIEDVVREELRPLLKAWLDANLPATVERLVRAEIERVMARQG